MSDLEFVTECGVTLVDAMASDNMVAMAAWVSNGGDDEARLEDQKKVKGLINFLYKNKHMSPFEHGQFIFKVDVPLFVAREFQRHRTFSYNEVSGRYTQMAPRLYLAPRERPLIQEGKMGAYTFVRGSDDQYALYLREKQVSASEDITRYERLLEAGIAKEVARTELPLSLMTQFYATCNPRNLMQFLTLRNDKHALKEIRDVAVKMEKVLQEHMPYTYEAYRTARDEEQNPPVLAQGGMIDKMTDPYRGRPVYNIHIENTNTGHEKLARQILRDLQRGSARR